MSWSSNFSNMLITKKSYHSGLSASFILYIAYSKVLALTKQWGNDISVGVDDAPASQVSSMENQPLDDYTKSQELFRMLLPLSSLAFIFGCHLHDPVTPPAFICFFLPL